MKRILVILVLVCFLVVTFVALVNISGENRALAQPNVSDDQKTTRVTTVIESSPQEYYSWGIEPIYAPKYFRHMGIHALRYDSQWRPHVVYGGDYLYYAYKDAGTWHYMVVDDSPAVGMAASLALDSNDQPHIAYQDAGDMNMMDEILKYAHWNGSTWQIISVDEMDPKYGRDGIASIAVDSTGLPHIIYSEWFYDSDTGYQSNLRYAHWNGISWQIELVENQGYFHSLVLDSADRPHISYYGGSYSNPDVYYAYKDSGVWHKEYVADGYPAQTDLVLDNLGRPHIAYHDDYDVLKHSVKDGGQWFTTTVDSDTRGKVSLAVDNSNEPIICYSDSNIVRFATWDGAVWSSEQIGLGPVDNGPSPSLALNQQDKPTIVYLNANYSLNFSFLDNSIWEDEIVDVGGDTSYDPSMALELDSQGQQHALFTDNPQNKLIYAIRDNEEWVTSTVTHTLMSGIFEGKSVSMDIDSQDAVHISFASGSDTQPLFYANNANGDWSFEEVDQVYNKSNAIAIDSQDNPHIAYCSDSGLRYTRWSGTGWITSTLGVNCFYEISLVLDSLDLPHLAFDSGQNLHYAYWNGSELVEEIVETGEYPYSINIDIDTLNQPHIAYRFGMYIRYAYRTGNGWQNEEVVSPDAPYPYPGKSAAIAMSSHNVPHVVWCAFDDGIHIAVRDQTTWHDETVDTRPCSASGSGRDMVITLNSDDEPFIGYHLENEGDVMMAYHRLLEERIMLPIVVSHSSD